MRKKVLLFVALLSLLACLFAMGISAEAPAMYVEFDVLLDGNAEYTTAYVQNTDSSNPNVNLTLDFYSDKDFTIKIDKSTIVAIDFSQVVTYGDSKGYVSSFTTAGSSVFPKCEEIKWFSSGLTTTPKEGFKNWTQLKRFDLGCVQVINESTFNGCSALESIVIPSSVTDIMANAFRSCTSLNSVIYEGTPQVKTIGGGAFQYVPASNLTLPSSLEKITGQKAFAESGIQTVVIPAGCTGLSTYTFNKSNVTSVSFAEGFTGPFSFEVGTFQTCSQLTSIELAEGVTVIGQDCFNGASIVTFELPDSVTEIKSSAFANCRKLTTFTINPTSKLTTLGSQVFKDGMALTSFYFPDSLTSIGSGLFIYNNGSLKELVNFENCGVTSIPSGVFSQCSGLKEVKFPYGVTEINGSDLLKWANLDSITLPQTLKTITNPITCNSVTKIIFAAPDGTPLPANAPNTTVEYVNYCETYFASAHIEGGTETYTYIDENGNPTTEKYTSALKVACPCGRNCGVENVKKIIPALFVNQGFSQTEYEAGSILISFVINHKALDEYKQITGNELTYGIFAVAQQNAQDENSVDKEIINADGTAIKGVASVDFSKHDYDIFAIRITGFETDEQKDIQLALGAYVIENGKVSYLQEGKPADGQLYTYVSFNSLASYVA